MGKAKDLQATAAAEGFYWTELAQVTAGFEEGLEVMTMRPTRNRRNMTRSYILSELLDFWVHELGEKPRGKDCERFLAACITPVAGPTSLKAIARWLERYHRGEIILPH